MTNMTERVLTSTDRLISGLDNALRTIAARRHVAVRQSPAASVAEHELTRFETSRAAGLMRVNHAGEVAAQGLYQGHAAVARDPAVAMQMKDAAEEERDHLGWCDERLAELGSGPSRLSAVWYAGAFVIGAASGLLGDKWSLGFIEETEKQVSEHLRGHLDKLPENDARSRAIVSQMRDEEEQHGVNARRAGAAALPGSIRGMMRLTARIMTLTSYKI
jgi:ubiquinone biosynthesis monooxygenase Coq7